MRSITLDVDSARSVLGPKLAEAFISVVADMRDAMFCGELPDQLQVTREAEGVRLHIALQANAFLELEPLGKAAEADAQWKSAHRVRLRHVVRDGETLV